jgi:hypothetical protein
MKPSGFFLSPFLIVALLLFLVVAIPVVGEVHTLQDRQATYPPQVQDITHAPQSPGRGQTIQITLTLADPSEPPQRVSLIWCRVEPDYVCAHPELFAPEPDGTWTVTIPGRHPSVIEQDTRHIGYNISLHYPQDDGNITRVFAPTHNTWTPDTFPEGTSGRYYFILLQDGQEAPTLPLVAALLATTLLVMLARPGQRDGEGR